MVFTVSIADGGFRLRWIFKQTLLRQVDPTTTWIKTKVTSAEAEKSEVIFL